MNSSKKKILVEIIASLFILLFVYAALSKFQDFEKFRVELGKSPVLNVFSDFMSVAVPIIELLVSIFLTIRRFQLFALYMAFNLMVMFCVYIIIILKFSPYIPCSCGGVLQNMTWKEHLLFNIGFLILGALAIMVHPNQYKNLMCTIRGDVDPLNRRQ